MNEKIMDLLEEIPIDRVRAESDSIYHPFHMLPYHGIHTRSVSCVKFAPSYSPLVHGQSMSSNNWLQYAAACASGSADSTVKIWRIPQMFLQDSHHGRDDLNLDTDLLPLKTHQQKEIGASDPNLILRAPSGINDVAWSPSSVFEPRRNDDFSNDHSSNYLATACDDKSLYLWDVRQAFQEGGGVMAGQVNNTSTKRRVAPLVEFKGHSNFCFSVTFNPQGNILASGSFDETVKLWDVRSGDCVMTLPAHSDPVTCIDFSKDGSCLVSSSHDGLIRIWDVATGQCLKTIFYSDEENIRSSSNPSDDHNKTNGSNHGGRKHTISPPVGFVKYSPNSRYILSGTLDGKLRLSDINNRQGQGRLDIKTYTGHVCKKFCIFSDFMTAHPGWKGVVTGSEDGFAYIYDIQRRQIEQKLMHSELIGVLAVASHPFIELLATGGEDKTVRFWAPHATQKSVSSAGE